MDLPVDDKLGITAISASTTCRYAAAVRWLVERFAEARGRRRTRQEFDRLRVELEALHKNVMQQPWWSDLPPDLTDPSPRRRKSG